MKTLFFGTLALLAFAMAAVAEPPFQTTAQPSKPPVQVSPTGRWVRRITTSKMDDSKTVVLSLDANMPISGWPGKTTTPTLIVRCQEGELATYIVTGMSPTVERGNTEGSTVFVRFDKKPAEELQTGHSTSGDSLFFPVPRSMILALLEHQSMLFRFTPFNSVPQETSFSLRGLKAVIGPLYAACDCSPEKDLADEKQRFQESIAELKSPEWLKRAVAAKRLGELAESKGADKALAMVPTAIPDLVELLNDSDMVVRLNAATALGLFGPAASSAIPALAAAAEDKKRDMRASAEQAILRIGPHP